MDLDPKGCFKDLKNQVIAVKGWIKDPTGALGPQEFLKDLPITPRTPINRCCLDNNC